MNRSIFYRVKEEANELLRSKKTIREIADLFHVSKSTVHKDLQERLNYVAPELITPVKLVLQEHIEIRHIHGGESTKRKYAALKHKN